MKKVLVVDNLDVYLEMMEGILHSDFEVLKAISVDEAKKILEKIEVDAALVDVRMVEEDPTNKEGLELLKWIKKNHPEIPVIIMSRYQEHDYEVEALRLGAEYFLRKPIKPDELLEKLHRIIEEK